MAGARPRIVDAEDLSPIGYWQRWWHANKDRRNAERRERYARNARWRERELARVARAYRQRVQEQGGDFRDRKARLPRVRKVFLRVNGRLRTLQVAIPAELARLLGMPRRKLKRWEQDGVVPPARYRTATGCRLYTIDQVTLLRATAADVGIMPYRRARPAQRQAFKQLARRRWETIPEGVGDQWRKEKG